MTSITYATPPAMLSMVLLKVIESEGGEELPISNLNQILAEDQAVRQVMGDMWRPYSPDVLNELCLAVSHIITEAGAVTALSERFSPSLQSMATDSILSFMTSYPDLPAGGARRMFHAYLERLASSLGKSGHPHPELQGELAWSRMTTMMTMMGNPHMDTATLGTAWRLAAGVDAPGRLNMYLVANPNTPPAVAAALIGGDHTLTDVMEKVGYKWLDHIAVTHPDLAGLPLSMMADMFHAQTIPDEWFIDLFPTELNMNYRAPLWNGK